MQYKKRYRFSHADSVSGGRTAGAKSFSAKTGLFGMTPELRREASSRGGVTQGNIQGPKNRDSGQLERIRIESEPARLRWARSDENREAARKMGLARTGISHFPTIEICRLGQKRGGQKSRHVRHHLNRKLFNPLCPLCQEAKALGDIFYTAIYYPTDKRSWSGRQRKEPSWRTTLASEKSETKTMQDIRTSA